MWFLPYLHPEQWNHQPTQSLQPTRRFLWHRIALKGRPRLFIHVYPLFSATPCFFWTGFFPDCSYVGMVCKCQILLKFMHWLWQMLGNGNRNWIFGSDPMYSGVLALEKVPESWIFMAFWTLIRWFIWQDYEHLRALGFSNSEPSPILPIQCPLAPPLPQFCLFPAPGFVRSQVRVEGAAHGNRMKSVGKPCRSPSLMRPAIKITPINPIGPIVWVLGGTHNDDFPMKNDGFPMKMMIFLFDLFGSYHWQVSSLDGLNSRTCPVLSRY